VLAPTIWSAAEAGDDGAESCQLEPSYLPLVLASRAETPVDAASGAVVHQSRDHLPGSRAPSFDECRFSVGMTAVEVGYFAESSPEIDSNGKLAAHFEMRLYAGSRIKAKPRRCRRSSCPQDCVRRNNWAVRYVDSDPGCPYKPQGSNPLKIMTQTGLRRSRARLPNPRAIRQYLVRVERGPASSSGWRATSQATRT